MVVLEVCQRWRQVICAEKQFWRVVDVFRTLRWLSLCLTRAKAVDIYFHTSTSPSGLLSLLRSHDPAVRSLHFKPRSVGEGWVKFLQKFLSRPVALEVLDVSYVHRYSSSRPMHPSTLVGFNLEFPAASLTRLRILRLERVPLPQDFALYTNLEVLEVCTGHYI